MSRSVIVSKQLNVLELLKHIIFIILQTMTMTSPMSTIFLDLDKIELSLDWYKRSSFHFNQSSLLTPTQENQKQLKETEITSSRTTSIRTK